MTWLLAFLGFAALIILHEFGHFAAAKAVGMRVERFMLFFPPVLWSVKRGETEYGIGAIPLGGYVKITGMTAREELPPDIAYRAYHLQAPWKRIVVILAGPAMNVLIAFALLWAIFATQGKPAVANGHAVLTHTIHSVAKGAPADGVLRSGDRLVAVDGVRGSSEALRLQIGTHGCLTAVHDGCLGTPARLTIVRGGRTLNATVRPRFSAADGRPLLGFTFGQRFVDVGVGQAAGDAVSGMWRVTKATVSAIGRLFYSSKARKQVSSVVGGYETTREAFGTDTTAALEILAIVSLSLAIINLFPFLPLDGGHVFWALAEKVRGRPIPYAVMERAGVIGFVLVIMIFAIGLTNDIDRLRGKGFGVP